MLPAVLVVSTTVAASAGVPLARPLFELLDRDADGLVTAGDMLELMVALDHTPNQAMAHSALRRASEGIGYFDEDRDGVVSFEEFERAIGPRVAPRAPDSPTEVHIVNHGAQAMSVQWTTQSANGTVVQYGREPGNYSETAEGFWATYRAGDLYNTSLGFHGRIHTARMRIEDGAQYYYRVGDGAEAWSAEHSFQLTHAAGAGPSRIAWGGDMGTVIPAGWKVARQMEAAHAASPLHAAVIVGDIAYGTIGVPTMRDEFEFVWDAWFRIIEPLASQVPMAAVVGNHESPFDYSAFRTRFDMDQGSGGRKNFWYAFSIGRVRVVVISTEHSLEEGSAQRSWLDAELAQSDAAAARALTPWLVVTAHFPMYCTDTFDADRARAGALIQVQCSARAGTRQALCRVAPHDPAFLMRQVQLEPALLAYHVDVMIAGHHHVYERSAPMANGSAVGPLAPTPSRGEVYRNPAAPVHLTIGTFVFAAPKIISIWCSRNSRPTSWAYFASP